MHNFLYHHFSPDWFLQQAISAIIHSAIYGMAFHLFRKLSFGEAVTAGAAMLFVAWILYKFITRNRYKRLARYQYAK